MRLLSLVFSALLAASFGPNASATLINDQVTLKLTDLDFLGTFGPQDAVVGPGVEFSVGNFVDVDLSGFSILVSFRSNFPAGVNPMQFVFTDLDWIDPPGQVDDVLLTVLQGPTSVFNLAFTNNSITLTSEKISSPVTTVNPWVRLDVQVSRTPEVPEPSSLALCSMVFLAGLAPQVRRRLRGLALAARRSTS